jgi:hypothetical protein
MADHTLRTRHRERQRIPRIPEKEASRIFEQCERLLANPNDLVKDLREENGFACFLSQLEEAVLLLALQPDSWGERTKACLISFIVSLLTQSIDDGSELEIEHLVRISNIVLPCLLLEVGRRRQHVQVDFPANPLVPSACFRICLGSSNPVHSITHEQLQALVSQRGEELVGLCYFGDHGSRMRIEADLTRKTLPAA